MDHGFEAGHVDGLGHGLGELDGVDPQGGRIISGNCNGGSNHFRASPDWRAKL